MNKIQTIKQLFNDNRDEERATQMAAYMKNKFAFYGIPSPQRKKLYREFIKNEKKQKVIDWNFLNSCWAEDYREMQYLVTDYLGSMQSFLSFDDIPKLELFIRTKQWWDTIDFLDKIVGNIAFKNHLVSDLMIQWSQDSDFWVRRIAIDHQNGRKEKTDAILLATILINNLGSKEFFINKAMGWSLREYSKVNAEWVKNFIRQYESQLSKLTIREASKYL